MVHPRLVAAGAALMLLSLALLGPTAQGQDDASADASDPLAVRRAPDGTRGLQKLAMDLNARERALVRRERGLGSRESDLREAEAVMERKVAELTTVRERLEELLTEAEALEQERLTGLVKMCEKMREKQAAALLVELDRDLAVKVVDGMNRTKAGRALAAMDPKKAKGIAEGLTRPIELPGGL